jgi:hypothetical protein
MSVKVDGCLASLSVLRSTAVGAGLGLAWGVLMRLWMRFISDQPDFTIKGTALILAMSTFVGTCAGLAFAVRARGRGGRLWPVRVLALVSCAALAIGPGLLMVPTALAATLAVVRTGWPRAVRVFFGLLALGGLGFLAYVMMQFWPILRAGFNMLLFIPFFYALVLVMRVGVEAGPQKARARREGALGLAGMRPVRGI